MLNSGTIREAGLSDNPSGRKQILLQVNEDAGTILALDFDAEFVRAAVLDLQPLRKGALVVEPAKLDCGTEGLLQQLFSCARRALSESDLATRPVLGIGVGDPGVVNTRAGLSILSSTIDFWRDVPLRERFREEFGVPCVVGSNTRTRAVAEQVLGAGQGTEDMIYIEYGAGIGAGIITAGRLLEGHGWAAGEFGHTHVTENGPPCKCGSFGCLEAIAGMSALEAKLQRALREGGTSRCLDMAGGDLRLITGWHVLEAAKDGDKMSMALVEEMGLHLGLGVANLVNLFNPEMVILDGRLAIAGPLLLEQVQRMVRRQALAYSSSGLTFRFGTLGTEAGLLGAGLLALEKLFEVPALKPPRFLVDQNMQAETRLRQRQSRALGGKAEHVSRHP